MTSEELKYAISVMTASSNGACIQMKYKDESEWKSYAGGSGFSWEWGTFDYRVEPAKTLRPWKPEEVPVDAWYRTGLDAGLWFKVCQFNAINGTITNYDDDGWTPGEALAGLSHSTDGGKTWLRCGVEVDV